MHGVYNTIEPTVSGANMHIAALVHRFPLTLSISAHLRDETLLPFMHTVSSRTPYFTKYPMARATAVYSSGASDFFDATIPACWNMPVSTMAV